MMEKELELKSSIDNTISPSSTNFSGSTAVEDLDLEAQQARQSGLWSKIAHLCCPPTVGLAESTPHDEVATRLKTRKLEECPKGWPRAACFLSSDDNFTTYRGFSYLHSRVLLNVQDELALLERKLDALDKSDGNRLKDCEKTVLNSRREDLKQSKNQPFGGRQALLNEIKQKLMEYDDILMRTRDITSLQKPSNRDYRSVRNWFAREQPIVQNEQQFVECREDIITLRSGRECASFEGAIESALHRLPRRVTRKLFLTPELRAKTSSEIWYFSSNRVDTLTNLIITVVIFVLLVLPVVAMYKLTSHAASASHAAFNAIGVLMVFTLLFGAAMSVLTRARRHELFAASAAYCAVLVVFVGNFGGLGLS